MRWIRTQLVMALSLGTTVLLGCGGAVEPAQPKIAAEPTADAARRPAADRPLGEAVAAAMIRRADLGETWAIDEERARIVPCRAIEPWSGAQVRRFSRIFRSRYVAIQQVAAAFATPRAAREARRALASPPAQRCLRRSLRAEGNEQMVQADFQPVVAVRAEAPRRDVVARRLIMKATADRPPGEVFIDEIRAQRGRLLVETVVTSSEVPLREDTYEALVDLVADRLGRAAPADG